MVMASSPVTSAVPHGMMLAQGTFSALSTAHSHAESPGFALGATGEGTRAFCLSMGGLSAEALGPSDHCKA